MKSFLNSFLVFCLIIVSTNLCAAFDKWPDTGQTYQYTDSFGEDSDYTINEQSYTKLEKGGIPLPDDATVEDGWVMTKDNITGLIWEIKTDDDSIHDKRLSCNYFEANDYIESLNNENFGNYSDWRMPTLEELSTIINFNETSPAINKTFFPNTTSSDYWSSNTDVQNSGRVWCVDFRFGGDDQKNKSSTTTCFRAVRSDQPTSPKNMIDNGDGTITDTTTGLMWQQSTQEDMDWESVISYCESLTLGGYNDWRLPNINELKSLVDYLFFLTHNLSLITGLQLHIRTIVPMHGK